MSDLMMNAHTSVTDKITLLTSYCMADHNVRTNDECTHVCYSSHYLNVVCHITMSYLLMNVHTSVTTNTTYILLYVRSL